MMYGLVMNLCDPLRLLVQDITMSSYGFVLCGMVWEAVQGNVQLTTESCH